VEWERIRETWLHTLGNLTLTGYNSEYSDRTFVEKRDMQGGFKESPLRLNQRLGELEQWNEETIKARAKRLSEASTVVWRAPQLQADIIEVYRSKTTRHSGYTIEDHPYLSDGSEMYGKTVKELFESLRKEILELDPCVTEEFLKLYVAYKAETNFVDVVPQAKRLRLSLNMLFADITDPRGLCKDVTGLGRWGNGDVEVGLNSPDELPYVMGLVRQAFERQMGYGGDS
jgi:predicted transport protein